MNWIKETAKLFLITLCLFLAVDFVATWLYGARGFSHFFVSNNIEGRHNKPGFSGGFGGLLDEFNGHVNIGSNGQRLSTSALCENVVSKVLFIGDSTTAGFEVDDNETFISHFNNQCITTKSSGTNFGVRAHDTHSVIGTYKRVSSKFVHSHVVYLMTENDFKENMQSSAYLNMTKRFGRLFEGEIIKPNDDLVWSVYASLRMFVADKLSITTFLIKAIKLPVKSDSVVVDKPTTDAEGQAKKAFELIQQLSFLVTANNAELIIIPYPRLNVYTDGNRDEKIKILNELIENNLSDVSYLYNIDSLVDKKISIHGKELTQMRFRNDGHLSSYGHEVMSQVLVDVFENLNNYAQ